VIQLPAYVISVYLLLL